jgi:hypothetical protein
MIKVAPKSGKRPRKSVSIPQDRVAAQAETISMAIAPGVADPGMN